jgi:hypothetical protein
MWNASSDHLSAKAKAFTTKHQQQSSATANEQAIQIVVDENGDDTGSQFGEDVDNIETDISVKTWPPKGWVVNTAHAKGSRGVLRLVADRDQWQVEKRGNNRGHLFWVVTADHMTQRLVTKRSGQRVSRIPGMHDLCKKVPFALLMRQLQRDDPGMFDAWPQTFVLPHDLPEIERREEEESKQESIFNGPMIYKPNAGTHGDGIRLILDLQSLQEQLLKAELRLARQGEVSLSSCKIYFGEELSLKFREQCLSGWL